MLFVWKSLESTKVSRLSIRLPIHNYSRQSDCFASLFKCPDYPTLMVYKQLPEMFRVSFPLFVPSCGNAGSGKLVGHVHWACTNQSNFQTIFHLCIFFSHILCSTPPPLHISYSKSRTFAVDLSNMA